MVNNIKDSRMSSIKLNPHVSQLEVLTSFVEMSASLLQIPLKANDSIDKLFHGSIDESFSTSVYDFISETTYAYGGNTSTNSR